MTPNQALKDILGRLIEEKGGLQYIEEVIEKYRFDDRNDKSRLKRALKDCLNNKGQL